jgi:thiamine phosphate synthase YjbQ (UPF0047 family)
VFLRVFFGEKIKNKVFCLKIDDFLNVFGFLVDYAEVLKYLEKSKIEYGILLVNSKDIAIIEVKYKAKVKYVDRLLSKKYTNFKKLYPEYKDYNHHFTKKR